MVKTITLLLVLKYCVEQEYLPVSASADRHVSMFLRNLISSSGSEVLTQRGVISTKGTNGHVSCK